MKNPKASLIVLFALAFFLLVMQFLIISTKENQAGAPQAASVCSFDPTSSTDKEQKYEGIIQSLQKEVEELKTQKPETRIKEVIKEVPVEKIVIKEVVKKEECNPNAPYIKSVDVTTTANSATIKWETDKVTKSEVSISGGNFSVPKIVSSTFGSATKHRVDIAGLTPLTFYNYEIRAFVVKNGETLGSSQKLGGFATKEIEEEE